MVDWRQDLSEWLKPFLARLGHSYGLNGLGLAALCFSGKRCTPECESATL